jgi:hypothetical protein
MSRDPLATALRVRSLAVDAARIALADALAAEHALAGALDEVTVSLRRETALAADIATDDARVEAFAAWLRVATALQARSQERLATAEALTAQVRAAFVVARTGAAAVEALISASATKRRTETERQAQITLQEFASRRQPCQYSTDPAEGT